MKSGVIRLCARIHDQRRARERSFHPLVTARGSSIRGSVQRCAEFIYGMTRRNREIMTRELRIILAALLLAWCGLPMLAQEAAEEPADTIEEVLVVTASRTEQKLHDVPASITVITSDQLETIPADDYGDILRNVPGINVTQIGARDIQVSSRQAVGSLATGQLVLVDGRTLYLDFFGFVIWEFLPLDTAEVKQIEVVQGPGSSVWGANAMQGVVNVITKSPKELEGTHLKVGAGELESAQASIAWATASEKTGFKVSASYFQQDEAYDRPTGIIPGTQTPYPAFENSGTSQPRIDLRYDIDTSNDTTWSFSTGYSATDGLMHTGIGPFDIDDSSNLSYVKGSWSRLGMNITAFANILDGNAANLLTVGPDGRPLELGFDSNTYNIDFTNTSVIGQSHVLTYGINARKNEYDLSIAPTGTDREEYGIFLNDEILIGDHVRWVIGARVDDIDPVGTVVSPRTTLMISPKPNHTLRFSYNEAYRAPSLIENHLDIIILNQVLLPAFPPLLPAPSGFIFPSAARGNPELGEEQLEALEIGYVGTFDKSTFSVSIYENELKDATDFFTAAYYDSSNPPPGWPLPPFIPVAPGVIVGTVPTNTFPALFSYRNVGSITNTGVEFSVDARPKRNWRYNFNLTWQDEPEVDGILLSEVNMPPATRLNFGVSYDSGKFYANGNLNYQDEAFWTDVLDSRFHGPTEEFGQINLGFGWRFNDEKIILGIIGSNITDEDVQQHVFGDIISRKISAELRFVF